MQQDLFNDQFPLQILPFDGSVIYYGKIFKQDGADRYFKLLMQNIDWKNDEALIYGKHFITPRKVAWYADKNYSYTYSGTTKNALLWTSELSELKRKTEECTQTSFNSCLLNLYNTGQEGMAWHSDDEKSLAKESSIASLSFGAKRKFSFKHKRTKEVVSVILEHGSLLVMKDKTQINWMHRLPPTKKVKSARINLTFRTMLE